MILAIVLVVSAILLKDTVARSLAEQRIRRETGFEAKIGKLQFNLFAPTIQIDNCVLYNPAEFGGSPIMDIPDLHIEYDRQDLALGQIHLKLLRVNLRELHVVLNQAGRTNLIDLLDKVAPEAIGGSRPPGERDKSFGGIDMLNLSVGKVRYTDLRQPRRSQEIEVGMRNSIIQNIRTEQDFAGVLFKILLRAGITIYSGREVVDLRKSSL